MFSEGDGAIRNKYSDGISKINVNIFRDMNYDS